MQNFKAVSEQLKKVMMKTVRSVSWCFVKNQCLKHEVTYFQQLMTIPHVGNVLPLCIFLLPANSSESSSFLLLGCMHSLFLCRDVMGNVLVFEQGFHKHRNVNLQSPENPPPPTAVAPSLKTHLWFSRLPVVFCHRVIPAYAVWCPFVFARDPRIQLSEPDTRHHTSLCQRLFEAICITISSKFGVHQIVRFNRPLRKASLPY